MSEPTFFKPIRLEPIEAAMNPTRGTTKHELPTLASLGKATTLPRMQLETFPNPKPDRDFIIQHLAQEFTSVCPKTGHPDFATIVMSYIADEICVELKSYKLYLQSFRNEGIFYEAVTNRLLDDLAGALKPRWMRIETRWTGRGGISSILRAEHCAEGFTAPSELPGS